MLPTSSLCTRCGVCCNRRYFVWCLRLSAARRFEWEKPTAYSPREMNFERLEASRKETKRLFGAVSAIRIWSPARGSRLQPARQTSWMRCCQQTPWGLTTAGFQRLRLCFAKTGEQSVALARAGMTVFRNLKSLQPARQVNAVVRYSSNSYLAFLILARGAEARHHFSTTQMLRNATGLP